MMVMYFAIFIFLVGLSGFGMMPDI